jgi:adenylate cyclase
VLVDFRGPEGTFRHVSALDVIEGRVGAEDLAGSIAIVGPTEVAIRDMVATPFASVFPGVEVHANVLESLLSGRVLSHTDDTTILELLALLAIGLAIAGVVPRFKGIGRGAAFAFVLLAAYAGLAIAAFSTRGIWINMVYPLGTGFAVYISVAILDGIAAQTRSRTIRRQFATYVPPSVVDRMVEHPEDFHLGTERKDLSILFSDIRDFTTIAEEIGSDVGRLLDVYLTPMTGIVFDSGGTLDKYIGDAVMAFWGAPLPVEDHPLRACESALEMQRETRRMRLEAEVPGMERVRIGVGIHTSEVLVGNMGSELRFDYTLSGDGANLCSRLEGLTKYYGVGILASGDLVARLPGSVVTREVDTIRVKGRSAPVEVHEVIALDESGLPNPEVLDLYAPALAAYRSGDWSDAEKRLSRLIERCGEDGPSSLLLGRIAEYERAPRDWDGIWAFETK